ncbi:hypothetical protein GZL_05989 [Streptomyces sp. 769]|nr:hypothetical protein GZL_05989 [Streptomyces sp. 769]
MLLLPPRDHPASIAAFRLTLRHPKEQPTRHSAGPAAALLRSASGKVS